MTAIYSKVPPAGPYLNKNVSLRFFFIPCNVNPNPEPVWSSGYQFSGKTAFPHPSWLNPAKKYIVFFCGIDFFFFNCTYSSKRIMNLCKGLQPKFPSIYWTWTLPLITYRVVKIQAERPQKLADVFQFSLYLSRFVISPCFLTLKSFLNFHFN